MRTNFESTMRGEETKALTSAANKWFSDLIQEEQYIGDVYSINYETALVLIHDFHRRDVGGIPSLSFLIATRIQPDANNIDYTEEDSSIILLRVMDAAPLPGGDEAERIRVESAQRVSGETDRHWDDSIAMDPQTHHFLSFAGVKCRVIGTFFLDLDPNLDPQDTPSLVTRFGSDLSNYYPNQGLTAYKPNEDALKKIVNYQDLDRRADLRNHSRVSIGEVRYASTNRGFQGVSDVEVNISPADLLEQKTALFGMTRTGKSNTTKIIAKSVFDLRLNERRQPRIGQIIFDLNGEYANQNVQDANKKNDPSALKNVWRSNPKELKGDVVTYGILSHPDDEGRKLMLINFYDDAMLQTGKEIINTVFSNDTSQYIRNFVQVKFEPPTQTAYGDREYHSARIRYNRRVLAYRALLKKAGFRVPSQLIPNLSNLFGQELIEAMQCVPSDPKNQSKARLIKAAAETLNKTSPSWDSLASAFEGLFNFLDTDGYIEFNKKYIKKSSTGESWADPDLTSILEMFTFTKGANQMGQVRNQHTEATKTDYAVDIYNELASGKLVIVDQSSGEPAVNESSAERIMWYMFRENQREFREGKNPRDILIYIEEAHNLLPSGSDLDLDNVWVRTAKEGAKYRLGMVYITQEVSSIQKNILKNTANWFIGHLNNSDETRELCKFYDFADFEKSILRAQDRGFLRVKTLSNLFVVPVQIKKFEV